MTYNNDLVNRFWVYVEQKNLRSAIEKPRTGSRPPVFPAIRADGNVILCPDASMGDRQKVVSQIPKRARHRWFGSMKSSQALAQSVFGNLIVYEGLNVLRDLKTDTGEPLLGFAPESASLESPIEFLGEPRRTEVDVLVLGEGGHRVAIECKLSETAVGACSRPSLTPDDPNYKVQFCDGSYACQRGRKERCSLTHIGVKYWEHIPKLFAWKDDRDYQPCPIHEPYQLVRNVLAACANDKRPSSPRLGHAVLLYDNRNPAFQAIGKGQRAFQQTRNALRDPSTLRKCSWQAVLGHLRQSHTLPWLTDEVQAKYGF